MSLNIKGKEDFVKFPHLPCSVTTLLLCAVENLLLILFMPICQVRTPQCIPVCEHICAHEYENVCFTHAYTSCTVYVKIVCMLCFVCSCGTWACTWMWYAVLSYEHTLHGVNICVHMWCVVACLYTCVGMVCILDTANQRRLGTQEQLQCDLVELFLFNLPLASLVLPLPRLFSPIHLAPPDWLPRITHLCQLCWTLSTCWVVALLTALRDPCWCALLSFQGLPLLWTFINLNLILPAWSSLLRPYLPHHPKNESAMVHVGL